MSIASFRPSVRVSRRSARRRPARVALTAWWHGTELDYLLAGGANPGASAELALRARNLTSARSRTNIANGLAGVRRSADKVSAGFTAAVRPRSDDVLEAAPIIASIEARLRAPEPVAAQGVAQIRLLLIDGNGPLYRPGEPGALADELQAAAGALTNARD